MQLIVFGIQGAVGKQLIRQALYKGHHVKAFGRNVFTDDLPNTENLELVQGALFDKSQIGKAIKGCDAVLCALQGSKEPSDKSISLGTLYITDQMKKAGVQRIIALSSFGLMNDENNELLMEQDNYPVNQYASDEEYLKAYHHVKNSGLDWTLVCASEIIDREASGSFTTTCEFATSNDISPIYAGDVAMCMLNELNRKEFVGKRIGISNHS